MKQFKGIKVMHDIETLGTKPGCSILSIGAVPFGVHADLEPFYVKISRESCREVGLVEDAATLAWWDKQSPEARLEAFSGTVRIELALLMYADYLKQLSPEHGIAPWGNGASFDSPVLAAAYNACFLPLPWDFRNEACYRTLKNMIPMIPYTPPAIKHNALQDALAQAAHAERIMEFLETKGILI